MPKCRPLEVRRELLRISSPDVSGVLCRSRVGPDALVRRQYGANEGNAISLRSQIRASVCPDTLVHGRGGN